MNAQQFNTAIKLTTQNALKSGLGMAEVVGVLEIAKANVMAIAISKPAPQSQIVHVPAPVPPGLEGGN